ncbi:MAG TPA: PIG-L deacetylase family protein [Dehalococcoidia bacterium]|nr:PIG-L deacetylase family protein [Dehalococcoidia bacterium]
MEETPQRVLVVTPHPDDAEIWCGGTIARWIGEGAEVHYVLCTDGGKGSDRPGITSKELSSTREKEQLDAARILDVKDVVMLHHSDGELEDTGDFRKELVRQIRLVRPEVVLTTEPYRVNLSWHRDHRITGQVTIDAVFPYARDYLHFMDLWEKEGLEPHKTGAVLFWGTERPDTFIDIAESLKQKIESVKAHRSQMANHSQDEIVGFITRRAEEAGAQNGYKYAEAFRKVSFRT